MRLALFGGVYNNYLALQAAIADAKRRGADAMYCLGDLGAFGPHPDRTIALIREHSIPCVQGNYDHSIGYELSDCQCGYTDPRDNAFAQISFDYTLAKTSDENKRFLRTLPPEIRLNAHGRRVLLCHGSPRRTNEFLWESTTSTAFLQRLAESHGADVIFATHTGLHWQRPLSGGRVFANVGVLGRPANDGTTRVWYAVADFPERQAAGDRPACAVEFVPIEYDHRRLAREMRAEKLPEEFVETILTGWWTTCMEVLPAKERRLGRY